MGCLTQEGGSHYSARRGSSHSPPSIHQAISSPLHSTTADQAVEPLNKRLGLNECANRPVQKLIGRGPLGYDGVNAGLAWIENPILASGCCLMRDLIRNRKQSGRPEQSEIEFDATLQVLPCSYLYHPRLADSSETLEAKL